MESVKNYNDFERVDEGTLSIVFFNPKTKQTIYVEKWDKITEDTNLQILSKKLMNLEVRRKWKHYNKEACSGDMIKIVRGRKYPISDTPYRVVCPCTNVFKDKISLYYYLENGWKVARSNCEPID